MTIQEKLEAAFAAALTKVRALSEERQLAAIEALAEISADEPYVLSDDELAIVKPALEDAKRGVNLVDAEDLDLLNKPWA